MLHLNRSMLALGPMSEVGARRVEPMKRGGIIATILLLFGPAVVMAFSRSAGVVSAVLAVDMRRLLDGPEPFYASTKVRRPRFEVRGHEPA